MAFDKDFNPAFIGIWNLRPANFLNFSFLYRNYSKKYLSFTSKAFGEDSKTSNEEGVYFGTMFQPIGFLLIETWIDVFKFPWLISSVKMPSSGYDYLCQTTFLLSRKFNISMRYKQKQKRLTKNEYFRTTLKYSPIENLAFTNSIQWSYFNGLDVREKGYLMYLNLKYSVRRLPLDFSLRYALFSAPYNARIYAFEDDVTYSFSSPAYYYKGVRYYALVGYNFAKRFALQFRLSQWKYFDRESKTELNVFFKVKI